VLTAADLLQFEKRVGGLNRVATVLFELAEEIRPEDFSMQLLQQVGVSTLQRLGYLLEEVCNRTDLADALFAAMQQARLSFFRIPLKIGIPSQGFSSDKRWKVIPNVVLEMDF
jgi:predicted transcriptional regulator of viral defense system